MPKFSFSKREGSASVLADVEMEVGPLRIKGFKVMRESAKVRKGDWVSWPSAKSGTRWFPAIVFPVDDDARDKVNEAILKAWNGGVL